ncbi:MAG: hypothetical protein K2K60_07075 [Clostridia bacterium]|nr:hypothetical protein [Clostridia bacterium]
MKKFSTLILALIVAICFAAFSFSGCLFNSCGKSEKKNYVEVSNFSELKAAKDDILLTQDIDCDFASISKIICKSINGQGHTIKNAVLNDGAFFEASEISNLNFQNVTSRAVSSDSISIVANARLNSNSFANLNSISIENVTVENCTINMPQSNSSIYAGIFVNRDPTWYSGSCIKLSFKNCYAKNVTMQLGAGSISSIDNEKKWSKVYFGGLVSYGRDVDIEHCGIDDCDFSAIGKVDQTVYGGGLIGYLDELRDNKDSIKDSYVKNTYITACAPNATVWAGIAVTNTADVYIGGLAGYFAGASVNSSYSSDNYIFGGYCEVGDKSHIVGGLFAVAKNCAVSSCFTFSNKILTDDNGCISISVGKNGEHYLSDTTYSSIAGFIASASSVSATNCAAANNLYDSIHNTDGSIHIGVWGLEDYGLNIDDKLDEFWFGGTTVNCYVTEPVAAGNSRNLPAITEDAWLTPSEIKNKLNLIGEKWVFENGKAPYLSLNG